MVLYLEDRLHFSFSRFFISGQQLWIVSWLHIHGLPKAFYTVPHKRLLSTLKCIDNKVQRRAPKLIPGLKEMSFEKRLSKLQELKRRFYCGLYTCSQDIWNHNWACHPLFGIMVLHELRRNSLKWFSLKCFTEKRKHCFTLHVFVKWLWI